MGAEVTVLSQSLKKMEDGLRLGAKHYYATSDRDTFKKLRSSFDLILNTVSANLDLGDYLELLDVDGTLVELGIPEHPMEVPAFPLALARRSLSGSNIGGIAETQEMLDFCAEHDVTPEIEVIEAGLRQRSLRAGAGQRRALPLRDRHLDSVSEFEALGGRRPAVVDR